MQPQPQLQPQPQAPAAAAPAAQGAVASAPLSLGDGGDNYAPLLSQGLCDVVGFEPAPGECERLNEAAARRPAGSGQLRFFPTFVGDGQPGAQLLSARSPCQCAAAAAAAAAALRSVPAREMKRPKRTRGSRSSG